MDENLEARGRVAGPPESIAIYFGTVRRRLQLSRGVSSWMVRSQESSEHLGGVPVRIERLVALEFDEDPVNECRELLRCWSVFCSLVWQLRCVSLLASRVAGRRTSSRRPSSLNCHAGTPSPVSILTLPPAASPVCQLWPDTVCERKRRSVRMACTHISMSHIRTEQARAHGGRTAERVLDLSLLAGHLPVEPALKVEQALVHRRVGREGRVRGQRRRERLVTEASFPD
jgi:hypothetical protein